MSLPVLRPRLLPLCPPKPLPATTKLPSLHHQKRLYSSPPETLTAQRTLPYPALTIFDILTDIPAYPEYIPFCTSATTTTHSLPDEHYQRKWPHTATLRIGYGDQINESFTSSVYCHPPIPERGRAGIGIIEAVSGSARHSLDPETVGHHLNVNGAGTGQDHSAGPLEYLKSTWHIHEFPFKPAPSDGTPPQEGNVQSTSGDRSTGYEKSTDDKSAKGQGQSAPDAQKRTDVSLSLEYRFGNPVYEMMGKAMTGKVAEKMIEAFVKRIEKVAGERGEVGTRVI